MVDVVIVPSQTTSIRVSPQPTKTVRVGIPGPAGRDGEDSATSFAWQTLSQSEQMVSNHAYFVDAPILLLLNLPIEAVIGDRIRVIGQSSGGWRITQNADQQIQAGNVSTTLGITGKAESIEPTAQIEIVALDNLRWCATFIYGNLELW